MYGTTSRRSASGGPFSSAIAAACAKRSWIVVVA